MAKKKSKTQKMKKSQKQKQKKIQKKILEQTEALKKIQDSGANVAPSTKKAVATPIKKAEPGKKELVPKNKVNYNVAVNSKKKKQASQTNKVNKSNKVTKTSSKKTTKKVKNNSKRNLANKEKSIYNISVNKDKVTTINKEKKQEIKETVKNNSKNNSKNILIIIFTAIASFFKSIGTRVKLLISNIKKNKAQKLAGKNLKKVLEKKQYVSLNHKEFIGDDDSDDGDEIDEKEIARQRKRIQRAEKVKNSNWFIRFIYNIISNRHLIFNAILIVFFIVLLIGLIKIDTMQKGTIIYISLISIFLMLVAISFNRYLSGKIFTILLCVIMGYAIYRINYTYDFIRSLNTAVYESKTYYIVTLDNSLNKSIYNINNKRVGIYNENTTNIERKLNTKLGNVKYVEYDNLNEMFDDFYDQNYRAILVNENQYKYMKNYINKGSKSVKILYEFKANAKK